MNPTRLVIMMLLATTIVGCAGLKVESVADTAADEKARGFRYYESAPYVLVHTDNKGGLTTTLMYLPDLEKKMSARPYNFMASNNTTLEFSNGMLTRSKSVVDETAVPAAVIEAVRTAAVAAAKAAFALDTRSDKSVPEPSLFKIVKEGQEWSLEGSKAEGGRINITVAPQ